MKIQVEFTPAELEVVLSALDSHRYWQLSEPPYRNDGYVQPPGTDDEEDAEEIELVNALEERLEALRPQ